MKTLKECIKNRTQGHTDKKPENYYDIYESHFAHLRNEPISLFEIGVRWGGSIWGWRNYFNYATIIGMDIDSNSMKYGNNDPEHGVKLYLGDQMDETLLHTINSNHGPFNIIIDDGGHTMEQQLKTFKIMWPLLQNGGIYVIEDTHTSYWPNFGGGYKRTGTFMEFIKDLIDSIHAYHHKIHSRSEHLKNTDAVEYLDHSIYGLHVYDSIVILQKWDRNSLSPIKEINL